MSEPVAVIRNSMGNIYLSGPDGESFCMYKHVGEHLYTSSEIERKDAAIAELVELMREACQSIRALNTKTFGYQTINRFDAAIAKYELTTTKDEN